MFQRTISYKNLDGEPVEATYWFNIDASEIALLKQTHKQDIEAYFQRIINSKNNLEILKMFQELLQLGVFIRDGQRMDKSQDVKDEFMQTGAFNALFLELIQTKDQGAKFISDMFPQDLIREYEARQDETKYSDEQLLAMTNAEFNRIAGDKKNRSKRMTVIGMRRRELNKERNHGLTA